MIFERHPLWAAVVEADDAWKEECEAACPKGTPLLRFMKSRQAAELSSGLKRIAAFTAWIEAGRPIETNGDGAPRPAAAHQEPLGITAAR